MKEGKKNWVLTGIVVGTALFAYLYIYTAHADQLGRIQELEENIQYLEGINEELERKIFLLEQKNN